ncbi:MAG: hypothetical protein Q4F13_05040 [Pseudomonadota bacterium]|nr:hypothetical protein [Pseudomonadota bacterium]
MKPIGIIGIVFVLAGLAGVFTGGFSFTKDTTAAKIGPLELKVEERKNVNIPLWASGGAIAVGVLLLVLGSRKP